MAREAKTWLLIKKISPALPVLVCPRHPRPQACLNCLQMSLDGEWKGGREAWAQVAAAVVLNDGYWPPHWWPWWHKAEWLRPNSRSSATRLLRFPCAAPLQQRTRSDIRCHASPLKWLLLDIILRFCVFGIVTLSMCCAMVEAPAIRYSIKCHSCTWMLSFQKSSFLCFKTTYFAFHHFYYIYTYIFAIYFRIWRCSETSVSEAHDYLCPLEEVAEPGAFCFHPYSVMKKSGLDWDWSCENLGYFCCFCFLVTLILSPM